MTVFLSELKRYWARGKKKQWFLVLEDQLSDDIGPLNREDPNQIGIVLIESYWRLRRRPYHQQKVAFHLLNLRQFALEQAKCGMAIRYLPTSKPLRIALKQLIQELGVLTVMEPAEFEIRQDLEPLVRQKLVTVVPHEGWLTSQNDFFQGVGRKPPWRMDAFYRYVRRKTGILMQRKKAVGGQFSFDTENRRPWKGSPSVPSSFCFPDDPIKEEVIRFVQSQFRHHPGKVHSESLPGTKHDAINLWNWAKHHCLPHFGPYEDAMAQEERGLFHTRISALVNIHRLLPREVVKEVESMKLPLASKEGFIRQVLGWREFVHHVHRETNGFRLLAGKTAKPGDAGYRKWVSPKWKSSKNLSDLDGGAIPSYLGSRKSLPAAFWGETSGLNCLDQAIQSVWEESYSHHITRLMVLSNIATLLDVSPRQLTDWFWLAYTDSFDWVVEPNVLAMGTFALGPVMTTKPYVSGAAYLNRMSDYCDSCAFNPKTNCPITHLYWAFLARHQMKLQTNPRLTLALKNLKKRGEGKIQTDKRVFVIVQKVLGNKGKLTPEHLTTVYQRFPSSK